MITPETLHEDVDYVNYLWLSVEARILLQVIDSYPASTILAMLWKQGEVINQDELYAQIEKNTEVVREIFSRKAVRLLEKQPELAPANSAMQNTYLQTLRTMIYGEKDSCESIVRRLWDHFNQLNPPEKTLWNVSLETIH